MRTYVRTRRTLRIRLQSSRRVSMGCVSCGAGVINRRLGETERRYVYSKKPQPSAVGAVDELGEACV
jgi:hypothetical protein